MQSVAGRGPQEDCVSAHNEVKMGLQEWHLQMATVERNQEGHDALKAMLEAIDEVSAQMNQIIKDAQGKPGELDAAQRASAAASAQK